MLCFHRWWYPGTPHGHFGSITSCPSKWPGHATCTILLRILYHLTYPDCQGSNISLDEAAGKIPESRNNYVLSGTCSSITFLLEMFANLICAVLCLTCLSHTTGLVEPCYITVACLWSIIQMFVVRYVVFVAFFFPCVLAIEYLLTFHTLSLAG